MLPVLLGILACLPAPIGNPEKSRIDSQLNGIWTTSFSPKSNTGTIWILEPFDRRTWLVTWINVEALESVDRESLETENGQADLIDMLHFNRLGAEEISLYKAWLTEIGDQRFLTFEPKIMVGADKPMTPEYWWAARVRKIDENSLAIAFINAKYDGFKEAFGKFQGTITREQKGKMIERVIRRHIDDPELFGDPGNFRRIPEEDYKLVSRILGRADINTGQ